LILDTKGRTSQEVVGKISGLNLWSREMNEFEVLSMSVGCGHEKGDLLSWDTIGNAIKYSSLKTGPAGCVHGGGN
jgi:hypothetical protein